MSDSLKPMDCSPPGSSDILQARILDWVAILFSRGSSWTRDGTCISCLLHCRCFLYHLSHQGSQNSCCISDKVTASWHNRHNGIVEDSLPKPRWCFPGGTSGKEPPANSGDVRDLHLISEPERFSGEGIGNPLQYSCLENPMDRWAWWATVHRVAKSRIRLSDFTLKLF